MIDGELLELRNAAKAKPGFLEITTSLLVDLVYCSLSFDSDRIKKEDVVQVLTTKTDTIDPSMIQIVNNQKNAFLRAITMAQENIPMDENQLKDLHQIMMEGFSEVGGLYRNVDISLSYSSHTPPSYIKVYDRMNKYFDYTATEPTKDVFEYISYCHLQLAKIHPFLDGNGRLARLILNYHLMRKGFLPILINKDRRREYFENLEEFKVNKNIKPFILYLKALEHEQLTQFLAL
ncbi:MAG: Fic family protein [Bacilli bacterium]